MKVAAWKKWLLGILAVIMVYIWYDAFQMMYPETTGLRVTMPKDSQAASVSSIEQLQYRPPKVNPFRKPSMTQSQQAKSPQLNETPEPVAVFNEQYRLIGVLRRDSQSQAVVTVDDSSLVLSIGDSLDNWQLQQIAENSVVFNHGKNQDTLWLYTED